MEITIKESSNKALLKKTYEINIKGLTNKDELKVLKKLCKAIYED